MAYISASLGLSELAGIGPSSKPLSRESRTSIPDYRPGGIGPERPVESASNRSPVPGGIGLESETIRLNLKWIELNSFYSPIRAILGVLGNKPPRRIGD